MTRAGNTGARSAPGPRTGGPFPRTPRRPPPGDPEVLAGRTSPSLLREVVAFRRESFPPGEGRVTGGGPEFLVLDGDGRTRQDYQFVD